jgi:hypothetical protein
MTHLVFCDEFGNTGPHLFDPSQPIFAYAFLVLAQSELPSIEAEVRSIYQEEGLDLPELKSSRLWATPRGIRRYLSIGEILAKRNAHICMSIIEKRYQACVMIVETYLDPAYNEQAPPEVCHPRYAQMFADAGYDWLDDACLKEFLAVVHADDPQLIVDVGRRVSARLRLHPDDFVSSAAARMEVRADRVFRYSQKRPGVPNSHIPASQYLGFQPAIERLDEALEVLGVTALMVRDDDRQFGHLLDVAFSYARRLDEIPAAGAYGARRKLTRILGCKDVSSTAEFGVQLADLAAGLAGRVAVAALLQRPLDSAKRALFEAWRELLLPHEVHYWIFADATMPRVVSALFD